MKHPTKEQVLKVAQRLQDMVDSNGSRLNQAEGHVNSDEHICGTVHCHGGWYAVAVCDLSRPIDFIHGAEQMALDLGFKTYDRLKTWASSNPNIWGNEDGDYMFCMSTAFTPNGKTKAYNLQDIVDHWREVAERLGELEAKQDAEKYKPLTLPKDDRKFYCNKQYREYSFSPTNPPTETTGKELVENLN